MQLRQPEGVGPHPEEGAVAERRQAGMPEQQVESQGVDGPDHHLDAEIGVEPDRLDPERERGENDGGGDQLQHLFSKRIVLEHSF